MDALLQTLCEEINKVLDADGRLIRIKFKSGGATTFGVPCSEAYSIMPTYRASQLIKGRAPNVLDTNRLVQELIAPIAASVTDPDVIVYFDNPLGVLVGRIDRKSKRGGIYQILRPEIN